MAVIVGGQCERQRRGCVLLAIRRSLQAEEGLEVQYSGG